MTTPKPYYKDDQITLWHGDALQVLAGMPDGSVDCCVTSPPYYGLRDYGVEGQYGLEPSPAAYVETMRAVFAQVRRVLADDGTLWLNIGDSYSSASGGAPQSGNPSTSGGVRTVRPRAQDFLPPKNLLGMPWRVAFALQDDGWILRNAVVWNKPNPMPDSATDRLSCRYEQVFLLAKSPRYWFDIDPIREPLKHPDAADGTRTFDGVNKAPGLDHGSAARRTGRTWGERKAAGEATRQGLTGAKGTGATFLASNPLGRAPGDVWTITTKPFSAAHFAVMPTELASKCIISGCKPDGTVLDPFSGSGTTGASSAALGRRYVGIDLNAEYLDLSLRTRLAQSALLDPGAAS